MRYIKLFILGLLIYSCDNISEVLEQSDDINVILLEIPVTRLVLRC